MEEAMGRGTGFQVLPRERIDPRDRLYAAEQVVVKEQLPPSVDLRASCGDVKDQGNTQACTGYSTASAMEMLYNIEHGVGTERSPLFVYWNARNAQGWTDKDQGAYIFDAIRSTRDNGISPEKLHPQSLGVYAKPDLWARSYAWLLNHRWSYAKITDQNMSKSFIDELKHALMMQYGVVGGINLFGGFFNKTGGICADPGQGERIRGGHAIHWVGYVDVDENTFQDAEDGRIGFLTVMDRVAKTPQPQGFLIGKNSWGNQDGSHGFFLISYEYVDNNGDDFWAIIP